MHRFCTKQNIMHPISFRDWADYYLANKTHFADLDWSQADRLSDQEYKLLYNTLQQFQRGEHSEGKSLMRYAKRLHDPEYLNAIRLFIHEEQTHALVLGKFMDANDIPKIQKDWVNNVFQRMRRLASLENSIQVLLTAEIIGAVFYKALHEASACHTLRAICRQVLSDEEMHINFQAFTLKKFYDQKPGPLKAFTTGCRHILLMGTVSVVWMEHTQVLKAGGYTLPRFWRECFAEFSRAQQMIAGKKGISIRKMYKHVGV